MISEFFYPAQSATAHYMTGIAKGLAEKYDVKVICTTNTRDDKYLSSNSINNINIIRKSVPLMDNSNIFIRIFTAIYASIKIIFTAYKNIDSDTIVLAVTNPPLIPNLITIIAKLKHAKIVVRVDDVYPEALVASGLIKANSFLRPVLKFFFRGLFKFADRIVVLGRDMEQVICDDSTIDNERVRVIPNWGDVSTVYPEPKASNHLLISLGLEKEFVVLVAGTIGRVQGIDTIVKAAVMLKKSKIKFLIVGSGAKESWVKDVIKSEKLDNLILVGPKPKNEQNIFLNACDVSLLSLKDNMYGIGVPSRFYNYLAAGKPVIGAVHPQSEVAIEIKDRNLGWVVSAGDPEALAETLLNIIQMDSNDLLGVGLKARKVAELSFNEHLIISEYVKLIESMSEIKQTKFKSNGESS
jgi:glycosyltransferase involved in cell wall biosynthesis